jgi:hypothetical protein
MDSFLFFPQATTILTKSPDREQVAVVGVVEEKEAV